MKDNRGFTLIEILASICILFFIGTVFFQIFIMAQKATTTNEEKLVAVNLAKAAFEEIKTDSEFAGVKLTADHLDENKIYGKPVSSEELEAGKVVHDSTIKANVDDKYSYVFIISKDKSDLVLGLYSVEIKVYLNGENLQTTLEGLVPLTHED